MADKAESGPEVNGGSPAYYENDMPGLFKLFLVGIVIWGIVFALYFILTGYNSEKRFDAKQLKGSVRLVAPPKAPCRPA